jgi:hypothetical protein
VWALPNAAAIADRPPIPDQLIFLIIAAAGGDISKLSSVDETGHVNVMDMS